MNFFYNGKNYINSFISQTLFSVEDFLSGLEVRLLEVESGWAEFNLSYTSRKNSVPEF